MIVRTFEGLQALTTAAPGPAPNNLQLFGLNQAYAEIYRTQPNVRICVDFLARSIAMCALHAFRRVSDTDRVRLADHDLIRWIGKPNPATRRYRLIESLMGDLGIYFNAYWAKVRYTDGTGRPAIGLVRLPPEEMHVEGGLLPRKFVWTSNGREKDFAPSEIVYFNGYNPCNPLMGLSPMETLRGLLAEEAAAMEHREAFWRNSARVEGIVTRPKEKPRYTKEQADSWREQWQAIHSGRGTGGRTALLQDGETFTPASWSARDSEYTQSGKLRREVCAAAYMIPQPMVGILDHATFSNIREQHKHTYQDTLAPWMDMITQELAAQLLVECEDQTDVYIEFNIAAKLAGSFEEQANSLQILVGRPMMTANEGRARLNLPRDPDPDSDKIAPQQGGPAAPKAESTGMTRPAPAPEPDEDDEDDDEPDNAAVEPVVLAARTRLLARLNKVPAVDRPVAFFADFDRWQRELTTDLTPVVGAADASRLAIEANLATLNQLAAEDHS